MKLSESTIGAMMDAGLGMARVSGPDELSLPFVGPWPDRTGPRRLIVRVDMNVFFHCYCADPAVVRAYVALKSSDVDPKDLIDCYGVDWCPENDHLQVQGLPTMPALAKAVAGLRDAAAAILAVAFAVGVDDGLV